MQKINDPSDVITALITQQQKCLIAIQDEKWDVVANLVSQNKTLLHFRIDQTLPHSFKSFGDPYNNRHPSILELAILFGKTAIYQQGTIKDFRKVDLDFIIYSQDPNNLKNILQQLKKTKPFLSYIKQAVSNHLYSVEHLFLHGNRKLLEEHREKNMFSTLTKLVFDYHFLDNIPDLNFNKLDHYTINKLRIEKHYCILNGIFHFGEDTLKNIIQNSQNSPKIYNQLLALASIRLTSFEKCPHVMEKMNLIVKIGQELNLDTQHIHLSFKKEKMAIPLPVFVLMVGALDAFTHFMNDPHSVRLCQDFQNTPQMKKIKPLHTGGLNTSEKTINSLEKAGFEWWKITGKHHFLVLHFNNIDAMKGHFMFKREEVLNIPSFQNILNKHPEIFEHPLIAKSMQDIPEYTKMILQKEIDTLHNLDHPLPTSKVKVL